MTNELLEERDGAVARLVFNRPQARNAITFEMYDALFEACERLRGDEALRAVIVTGAGGAFAAGTDISQFRDFATAQDSLEYEARFERAVAALESLPVPVIAAVTGDAVGGGAAILLACDLRIAVPKARVGVPIARTLGNCLSLRNMARLVRAVGPARAKWLLMTGDLVDAHAALAAGLLNEVVDDAEARAAEVAARIAQNAPITVRLAKEAVARSAPLPDADDAFVLRAYLSRDFHEGVESFLAKRKPVFTGR